MANRIAVFYFSPIYYDFLYQRPQQLFREWRSQFEGLYTFYFVEPPSFITRFAARALQNAKRTLERRVLNRQEEDEDNARILTWMAFPRSLGGLRLPKWISEDSPRVLDYVLHKNIEKCCSKTQKKVAIVAFLFWEPFISKDDFDLVCYDYLDPVELYSASADYPVQEQHEKLIRKSDIIFVTAQNLKDDALAIADEKDVFLVSNGTDIDFFEKNKNSYDITDFKKTNKKRVGYMGTYHRVDMGLIYATAQKLTDVDFLLIGPLDKQRQHRSHQRPDNVFILGTKEYKQLPAYVHTFDVAIIPFKPSVIADSSDPVKLYDYFSLGKPVVATGLKELKKFDDGQLLRIAETQDEFVNAISAFLKYDAKAWQESRRQIARQNSWHSKASAMMDCIQSRIDERS
jgi:hypothetical protein